MHLFCFQIKADVETKGEFINGLIQKVLAAAYKDIEDVLKFVDWLDGELASLVISNACATIFVPNQSRIIYSLPFRMYMIYREFQLKDMLLRELLAKHRSITNWYCI